MSGNKITYSNIKQLSKQGDYNIYGIIYDASLPTKEDNSNYFMCTLKLIDPQVNCISNKNNLNKEILNLIIKSEKQEFLPWIHCIGDIIRINRGVFRLKKDNKKFMYINLTDLNKFKTNWLVFSGSSYSDKKEDSPIACSITNYNFDDADLKILSEYRAWLKNYFRQKESLIFPKEIKLMNRNSDSSDYDILLMVVNKKQVDGRVLYLVQDETDSCELHTTKYFNFLDQNDIIRVRNIRLVDGNRQHIVINALSNILKIPSFMNHSQELTNRIKKKTEDNLIEKKADNMAEIKRDDIIYSYVEFPLNIIIRPEFKVMNLKKYIRKLSKIYETPEKKSGVKSYENISQPGIEAQAKIIEETCDMVIDNDQANCNQNEKLENIDHKTIFKQINCSDINKDVDYAMLALNVLDYYPKNILDFCLIYCPNCKQSFFSKDYISNNDSDNSFYSKESEIHEEKYYCKNKCMSEKKVECLPYYNFLLICRENAFSNDLIKIYVSTFDYEGSDFLNIPIKNFYTNNDAYESLTQILDKIIKFENYIKILVEVLHQENNFVLRLIGNYKHQ